MRPILFAFTLALLIAGCSRAMIEHLVEDTPKKAKTPKESAEREKVSLSDYYEKFYQQATQRARVRGGTMEIAALDVLPKDTSGQPNWTAAVIDGYINPRGSLDPDAEEELPLNLNIFMEAKVPLMSNVIFPHSIHTYWLSCNNCHPKIFMPEAGANPITMDEIFKGEWCGRCHGKVAFTFWPRANCIRCHIIPKGQSMERERY